MTRHGPPLVFKTDNGSHFTAPPVTQVLAQHQVEHLRSPVRTPRYNGAVEAGIGQQNLRTIQISFVNGRPGEPTCDDVEQARLEANEQSRPWGEGGPSPTQRWNTRSVITTVRRQQFQATLACQRDQEQQRQQTLPRSPAPLIQRRAIRRTLEELNYLRIDRPSRWNPGNAASGDRHSLASAATTSRLVPNAKNPGVWGRAPGPASQTSTCESPAGPAGAGPAELTLASSVGLFLARRTAN